MAELTKEQLEERLAALHRASLELVSDFTLTSLLERIAALACEQADAQYGAVGIMNKKGELTQFIPIGMTPEQAKGMGHPPQGLGLIGVLMRTQESIRIPAIDTDPRHHGFPPGHPAMTSFLGVPIRQGDAQLGQIYLTNKRSGVEFTSQDQEVIETMASYAAVAISNARLYNQLIERDQVLSQRNENLALLNDLATTLTSSSDLDQILDKTLSQVMDYLHLDLGEVYLRKEDGKVLELVLHRSTLINNLWKRSNFLIGEGTIGLTAKNGQYQLISTQNDTLNEMSAAALEEGIPQVACFPLAGRRGVLGVLCIATIQPHPMDELEIQFLSAISSWMGTAIENLRLNLQQRRLAVLEERERIGMDLHDGIIQSIYAVGLTLEHARLLLKEDPTLAGNRIQQAVSDLNSTIRDIRTYILDLRPRQLHDEDLMQGLQRLVMEFRANALVEIKLEGPPDGKVKLSNTQAVALFHICQEALANVAKHAQARHVDIVLWTSNDRVLLEVSDDGHGFDTAKVKLSLGHGLLNIQTRARNAGGDVEFSSELGRGTTLLAWVPFTNDA